MTYNLQKAPVTLRTLKESLDPSYRIFCFPHGGGSVQSFRDWADALPDEVELICLDLPGRGKRATEAPLRRMDPLVAGVADALAVYGDRPFVFFGHSMGALVAYEVARFLETNGHPSPFHVIVSAHKVADAPADEPPMYRYRDNELTELVQSLGIVPNEAVANDELLHDFILPPLRADFELAETYDRGLPTPLQAAITAMGGVHDKLLDAEDLEEWQRLTASRFSQVMFDGDHFYTQSMTADVVSAVLRETGDVMAQLPRSVWFGPVSDYPLLPLHEQLRAQTILTPDGDAVVSEEVTLSYRELDDLSDLLSADLTLRGQGPKTRVGILMDTSPDYVVALFGILKSGAAYVALDTAQPPAALKRILEEAEIDVVLVNKGFGEAIPISWHGTTLPLSNGRQKLLGNPAAVAPVAVDIDAPAQIVFSSGTTGTPKGIVCSHRSAVASYQWRYRELPYGAGEREAANIFLVWEVMRPILAGVPVHLIGDDIIYDPHRLVDWLEKQRISRMLFTPSLLDVVLTSGVLAGGLRLPDLQTVYLNGEVVHASLVARAREVLPHVSFINDYSIAEVHDVAHLDLNTVDLPGNLAAVPVGEPQDNVSIYVLDDSGAPVPAGFAGELFVGGDGVGLGYLNRPELTAERFFPDPFRAGGRMFRTGDAGRMLADGRFEVIGRRAFMVKIRGYSVVPGAVEAVLSRCPGVCSAVVVPEQAAETGKVDRLVAYVVLNKEQDGWQAALRDQLKSELPHYAIPSAFVALDELPIAENGKLERSRLGRPGPREGRQPKIEVERCPVETALRAAWQDLLKADAPGAGDNFFDCGGHSLLAAQLSAQLRETLGITVRVVEVFLEPTFSGLLSLCRKRRAERPDGQQAGAGQSGGARDRQARAERSVRAAKTPARAERRSEASNEIAVIGMDARFPGADTVDALWENLSRNLCSIAPLSRETLRERGVPDRVLNDPDYMAVGAHLDGVELFDPEFWGLSDREATIMDPQHRLFLESCWKALESAGYAPIGHEGRTGVFAGSFLPLYLLHHLNGAGLLDPTDAPFASLTEFGNDKDYLASRVSYMLNLNGPSMAIQTSCSTGLVAIATAAQSLMAGHCDMALAGGASIIFPQAGYQYVEGFINSADGLCRAFDANASGTVLGDGVGVVVLKRLDDALAAGDPVQAVIKGCAINNDGRSKSSFSAPSARGQTMVVRQALEAAGLQPGDVEYVETHGTGTRVGDPIEIRALAEAFSGLEGRGKTCALGSIKPNIGHANIAAGVASFIKTVLSLKNGAIPATININKLNPDLGLEDTPFFVNEQLRPWRRREGRPRTAGVTSLGIGGTNCHVVLQEWAAEDGKGWPGSVVRGSHALCLSAKTPAALRRACAELAAFLRRNRDVDLGDVAHTLRVARCQFDYRIVVVARNLDMAIAKLEAEAESAGIKRVQSAPSVAFMLPGGGVQHPEMFKDLFEYVTDFREAFLSCAAASRKVLDRDIASLVFGEPGAYAKASFEEINVMMFAVQYAVAQVLKASGVHPGFLVGHSMSEYVAATLAGILKLEDAIGLMVVRSRAMVDLRVDGAMLAAKCSPDAAERILAEEAWRGLADAGELGIGVVNSNTSVVFTGVRTVLEELQAVLEEAEIPNQILNTAGVPSHSALMKPAAEIIDAHVRSLELRLPEIDIALNFGGYRHQSKVPLPVSYWSRQASGTIRFDRALAAVVEAGPAALVDLGPSRNLGRFAREAMAGDAEAASLPALVSAARERNDEDFTDRHVLLECFGALWTLGVPVDWLRVGNQLEPFGQHRRIALPTYSFERERCWPEGPVAGPVREPAAAVVPARRKGEAFTYVQSWTEKMLPRPAHGTGGAAAQRWFVLADRPSGDAQCVEDGLAADVTRQLESQGHQVVRVCRRAVPSGQPLTDHGEAIVVDPTEAALKALFEAEIASERPVDRILCLWQMDGGAAGATDACRVRTGALQTYEGVLDLVKALAVSPFRTAVDLWIAGDRIVQVGDEPVEPEKACTLGPAIVLPQENPMVHCRVIDMTVDDGPAAGDRLVAEIARDVPAPDSLVALRGTRRWTPHYPEVPLVSSDVSDGAIRPDGVYLITGALGRIGLSLTEHLVGLGATVIATSRRDLPGPSEWHRVNGGTDWMSRLAALKGAKGQVILRQCDVSDAESVGGLLDFMAREHGRVDGIFHAAGLADLKFLSEMDAEASAREFASKLVGTRNLYGAIERMQSAHGQVPAFVFLFSSLASVLGGPAMTAYAAANRFMDSFARQVQGHLGVRWVNSNWDDWDYAYEGQVTAAYETSHAKGIALSADEGIAIIKRILATVDNGQVIVATHSLTPRIKKWNDQVRPAAGDATPSDAAAVSGTAGEPMADEDARGAFLDEVKALLNASEISLEDNFFDIGGDSLLATALQVRLRNSDRWRPPKLGEIFKARTFGELYEQICSV